MIKEFEKYLKKRGVKGNWKMSSQKRVYTYILVIPVLDELESFPLLLDSLLQQPQHLLKEAIVIAVINNSESTSQTIRNKNKELHQLVSHNSYSFDVEVVDAYSLGLELPDKHAGVGLARKIGMDLALDVAHEKSVFGCLDADVVLSENYLKRLQELNSKNVEACVLSFEHQKIKKPLKVKFPELSSFEKSQQAIIQYEDFLKRTAVELEKVQSPYGYVPLGSAMFCSVKAYVAVGGMPKKKAAEDFYFLQALAKYCGVKSEVFETPIVFPSSRESERAYLGTGYRMIQVKEGFEMKSLNYHPQAFINLGKFINLALSSMGVPLEEFMNKVQDEIPSIVLVLEKEGILKVWEGFSKLKNRKQFSGQFHKWFDALKTLRCLKAMS